MTLCRRGRSVLVLVLVLTLVFGLVTASIIPAAPPDVIFLTLSRLPPQHYRLMARSGTGCFAMASLQQRSRVPSGRSTNMNVNVKPCSRFSQAGLHVTI